MEGCLRRGLCTHSLGQPITLNRGWKVVYVVDFALTVWVSPLHLLGMAGCLRRGLCTHLHAIHRYTRAVCTMFSSHIRDTSTSGCDSLLAADSVYFCKSHTYGCQSYCHGPTDHTHTHVNKHARTRTPTRTITRTRTHAHPHART